MNLLALFLVSHQNPVFDREESGNEKVTYLTIQGHIVN